MKWFPVKLSATEYYLPPPVKHEDKSFFVETELNCVRESAEPSLQIGKRSLEKLFLNQKISFNELSQIIFTTTSPDFITPSHAACLITPDLTPSINIHAYDVQSSCSSFLTALRCMSASLERNQIGVIVAAESKRRTLHNNVKLQKLFGDASAAILVEYDDTSRHFVSFPEVQSFPNKSTWIGTKFKVTEEFPLETYLQNGRTLYRDLVNLFCKTILVLWKKREDVLTRCGKKSHKVGGMIYLHQANRSLLNEVKKRLPIEIANRIPILMTDVGNTISVSIPLLRKRVEQLFLEEGCDEAYLSFEESEQCKKELSEIPFMADEKLDILISIGGGMQLVSSFISSGLSNLNDFE